jgi:hypothetical protein
MTVLDFSESEPQTKSTVAAKKGTLSGNAAFYERLQGQTKKTAMERFGWVALPVGAIAILGIVAATSTPNRSADNITAGPVDAKPAMTAAAPVQTAPLASNDQAASGSASIKSTQSAPPPINLAKRAAPAKEPVIRPASASRPQTVPVQSLAPAPTTAVNPPVTTSPEAAPPPIESQAPSAATPPPVESAPAAEAPAQ